MKGSTNSGVMTDDVATSLAGKQSKLTIQDLTSQLTFNGVNNVTVKRYGRVVTITFAGSTISTSSGGYSILGLPASDGPYAMNIIDWDTGTNGGLFVMYNGNTGLQRFKSSTLSNYYGTFVYLTSDGGGSKLIRRLLSIFRRERR